MSGTDCSNFHINILFEATFKGTLWSIVGLATKTMGIILFIFFAVISINVHCKPVSHTFLHFVEQTTDQVDETSMAQVAKTDDDQTEGKNRSSNYTDSINNPLSRRPDFIYPTKSDWELWSEQYTLMVTKVLPSMDLLWKTMEKTDKKLDLLMNIQRANEEINNKSDTIILMMGMITETVEDMENRTGTTNKLLRKSRGREKMTAQGVDDIAEALTKIANVTEKHSKMLKNSRKREKEMAELLAETKKHLGAQKKNYRRRT